MLTIAVGDIHGAASKLDTLLASVRAWIAREAEDSSYRFVFLGDYINRGPDTKRVLKLVQALQAEGAMCLRGNHEQMMIDALDDPERRQHFYRSGGLETTESLATKDAFIEAVEWAKSLPTSFEDERRYFVHAGVRPGATLADQTDIDRLWIRAPFLDFEGPFPKYIVHGHSPVRPSVDGSRLPDIRDTRCNLDTGAGWGGPLSAVIFTQRLTKPLAIINSANHSERCTPCD